MLVSRITKSVIVITTFTSLLIATPVIAAGPSYNLTINAPTVQGSSVTFTGKVSVNNFPGSVGSYFIAVTNWGDGSAATYDIPLTSVVVTSANFTANWSAPVHSYAPNGNYTVTVKLYHTGPSGNDNQATKKVTVNNHAPTASNTSATVTANQSKNITLLGSDSDSQSLTYAVVTSPSHGGVSIAGTVATYTPTQGYVGNDSFTYRASDGAASSAPATVALTIVNTAPTLSNVPTSGSAPELSAHTFTATASDTDVPAQTLTFGLSGAPIGATIGASSGVFSWTPSEAQGPGTYTFQVRVSDGVATTSATTTVSVWEVNTAPVSYAQTISTLQNTATSTTLQGTDSDLPAQTLTYSVSGTPVFGAVSISGNVATYTPYYPNFSGTDSFTYGVWDGVTWSNTSTVTVNILHVNHAPTLAFSTSTQNINELSQYTFSAQGSDPDNDTLTYSMTGAPTGATLNATNGSLSWTPTEAQGPGDYSFNITVSDGTLSVTKTASIHVSEVNTAPAVTNSSVAVYPNTASTITLIGVDNDLPAQTLTYATTTCPWTPHGTVGAVSGNTVVYTPNVNYIGQDNLCGTVSDGVATSQFLIAVYVGGTPQISGVPSFVRIPTDMPYTFSATSTNPNNRPVTIYATGLPTGASIASSTGIFTWTPTSAQGGAQDYYMNVWATDGLATSPFAQIDMRVGSGTLTIAPHSLNAKAGSQLTFDLSQGTSNPNGDQLTWNLGPTAPIGSTLNNQGGFAWTPASNFASGFYDIPVTAQGGGQSSTATSSVEVYHDPVVDPIPNLTVLATSTMDSFVHFHATSTNPNGYSLKYFTYPGYQYATFGITTGDFDWDIDQSIAAGTYYFGVEVRDGLGVADQSFTVIVTRATTTPQ